MSKKIYINRLGDHENQYLANLIVNEQIPIENESNFRKYKKIYLTSKAWIFFESKFDSLVP